MTKPVWKMTKAQLVDEIDERLAAKGQEVAYPPRADRLRFSKTELENECDQLRREVAR